MAASDASIQSSPTVQSGPEWWRTAVVYQIYPRSFADSDGDGIGDLPGITSRVPYLQELGVDAVWLCPFYPSALADGGYDVDDYRDVDPRLGTLADFDALAAALHAASIKVLIDIVPNHTSNRHAWFVEALAAGRESSARDRYIFRDGVGPNGDQPPNDWQSLFGGSAWERVDDGQWYLHMFAAEQPDLNWHHAGVRADFRETLRFWADRGVDGFRVDVAHGLIKDLNEPYLPWSQIQEVIRPDGSHPLWDREDLPEVYREWREVFNSYDPPRIAVAEASVHPTRRARYAATDGLGMAFNFEMQDADWDVADYRRVIDSGLHDLARGDTTTWLLGCHDTPRVATRYGLPRNPERNAQQVARDWLLTDGTAPELDRAAGERRARAAAMILLALPGSTYVYQGEELGLHEVGDLPQEALQDPMAFRSKGVEKGRDGCRVPLPWTVDGPSYGFGPGSANLPQPAWFADCSVAAESERPDSTLSLYRDALRLRRTLLSGDSFSWQDSAPDTLAFRRSGGWLCFTNFGREPVELPPGEVLLTSAPLEDGRLGSDTTAWLTTADVEPSAS
ncbi:MAG TPA: glycoside hydrolase family 13 protein [Microlunatus sp.]|nr:glycoside hydrolase family 13 protein [Microlunatus sp.]